MVALALALEAWVLLDMVSVNTCVTPTVSMRGANRANPSVDFKQQLGLQKPPVHLYNMLYK